MEHKTNWLLGVAMPVLAAMFSWLEKCEPALRVGCLLLAGGVSAVTLYQKLVKKRRNRSSRRQ